MFSEGGAQCSCTIDNAPFTGPFFPLKLATRQFSILFSVVGGHFKLVNKLLQIQLSLIGK